MFSFVKAITLVTNIDTNIKTKIANSNNMALFWGLDNRYQPTSNPLPNIKYSRDVSVGVQSLSLSEITNGDYYVYGYNGQNGSYTSSMTIAFIIIM